MRRLLKVVVVLIAITIMLLLLSIIPLKKYKTIVLKPLNSENETVEIIVDKGTFSGVLAQNSELFESPTLVKVYNRLNEVSISVKKGVYEVPSEISLEELILALETGKYNTSIVKVTIPEGYTIEQIGETLEEKDILTKVDFIYELEGYNLPSYVQESEDKRYSLEGYLFPDTYIFEKGMSGKKIIDIMVTKFEDVLKEITKENSINIQESDIESIVKKASVIEREVSRKDEKPLVSSVIENRIEKDMKLQIDATVLYALGKHKDRVLYEDLEIKSPYNTYYIEGLPVGPISNPGKDSLEAALFPSSTDYLYYMTKDGTNHKFFNNYNDFLKYKNE